eukprot:scaffold91394_cov20-Prasinocladus_malaysianus.AAC.1
MARTNKSSDLFDAAMCRSLNTFNYYLRQEFNSAFNVVIFALYYEDMQVNQRRQGIKSLALLAVSCVELILLTLGERSDM